MTTVPANMRLAFIMQGSSDEFVATVLWVPLRFDFAASVRARREWYDGKYCPSLQGKRDVPFITQFQWFVERCGCRVPTADEMLSVDLDLLETSESVSPLPTAVEARES